MIGARLVGARQSCPAWSRVGSTSCALIVFAAIVSLGPGCSTMKVSTEYDTARDFSLFRSYQWLTGPQPTDHIEDPDYAALVDQRIRAAVDWELADKRLRKVTEGRPHLLVTYRVIVEGANYPAPKYEAAFAQDTERHHFKQGTLIIDFIDPVANQLVWRGYAVGSISPVPSESGGKAKRAVAKLLKGFPPR